MASSFSARESRPLASTLQPKPQLDSLFLTKLVPEIRHMIYKYAFGGYKNLHIFIYEQSLVSLRCQNPTAVRLGGHDKCTGMSMYRSLGFDWNHGALKERPDPDSNHHISDILTACRTMYALTPKNPCRSTRMLSDHRQIPGIDRCPVQNTHPILQQPHLGHRVPPSYTLTSP